MSENKFNSDDNKKIYDESKLKSVARNYTSKRKYSK